MTLEKIKRKTLGQRFKQLILGKEKPNLLTRVSVISAFIIWVYLFSWQLLTFVSILGFGKLEQSDYIRATYSGFERLYGGDVLHQLFLHSIIQTVLYIIIFFSLILIWRKRKVGFLIFVIANLSTLFISFTLMGVNYMIREIPVIDYILILGTTIYFGIGLFIFYRKKKEES